MLIKLTEPKKRIIVLNKTDLGQKLSVDEVKELTHSEIISTSILKEKNLEELEGAIKELFFSGIENSNDQVLVTNQRQVALLIFAMRPFGIDTFRIRGDYVGRNVTHDIQHFVV